MTTHQDPTDPAPFSDEELDELDRLDKAGTPGPWRANGREIEQHSDAGKGYPLNYYTDCIDVATRGYDYSERPPREIGFSKDEDAQLAAAARNAIPRLPSGYRALREENEALETLRGENEALRAEIDELRNRLLEEHEGNPGRVEAEIWEKRAHDMETEAFLAKERLKEAREENERLRAAIARCANEIENSAGVNSAPFADMVSKILEDSAK